MINENNQFLGTKKGAAENKHQIGSPYYRIIKGKVVVGSTTYRFDRLHKSNPPTRPQNEKKQIVSSKQRKDKYYPEVAGASDVSFCVNGSSALLSAWNLLLPMLSLSLPLLSVVSSLIIY